MIFLPLFFVPRGFFVFLLSFSLSYFAPASFRASWFGNPFHTDLFSYELRGGGGFSDAVMPMVTATAGHGAWSGVGLGETKFLL